MIHAAIIICTAAGIFVVVIGIEWLRVELKVRRLEKEVLRDQD